MISVGYLGWVEKRMKKINFLLVGKKSDF